MKHKDLEKWDIPESHKEYAKFLELSERDRWKMLKEKTPWWQLGIVYIANRWVTFVTEDSDLPRFVVLEGLSKGRF